MTTPTDRSESEQGLNAAFIVEYAYSRSTGPVMARFLEGLRERKILGSRSDDGTVFVPARAYDPRTGEDVNELVEVGPQGTVETWSWVAEPLPQHAEARPFAWALIRLDGANSAMLHKVHAKSPQDVETGMRVRPLWAVQTTGSIHDIQSFVAAEEEPA